MRFFTSETLFLKTICVLFFIELGTRKVHLAGCTEHPTAVWVTQQARQLAWQIQDGAVPCRFLIRDRDTKFPASFDTVFRREGVEIVQTPFRSPRANAFAERWVRSAREDGLCQILILNERHPMRVLTAYVTYFNQRRPHPGLAYDVPMPSGSDPWDGIVKRRDVVGKVIRDYYQGSM